MVSEESLLPGQGAGGSTATEGPVGTLLPAVAAGVTLGGEAKLGFIPGGITPC